MHAERRAGIECSETEPFPAFVAHPPALPHFQRNGVRKQPYSLGLAIVLCSQTGLLRTDAAAWKVALHSSVAYGMACAALTC